MAPPPAVHEGATAHAKPTTAARRSTHAKPARHAAAKPKAHAAAAEHGSGEHASEVELVRGAVRAMLEANGRYRGSHDAGYFSRIADKQTPRATVVTCSDSRVQTNAFHADAVNDLFMVRDIGNQLATAEGSVEYGVRHLHTPLLMIVGHSVCGAIKAASGDFSALEPAIRKELLTINIDKGVDATGGALANVNNQVDAAMLKFSGEVESGRLAVIGAFYDFRNDLGQGAGKLVITNVNGETSPARVRELVQSGKFLSGEGGGGAPSGH